MYNKNLEKVIIKEADRWSKPGKFWHENVPGGGAISRWIGEKFDSDYAEKMEILRGADDKIYDWTKDLERIIKDVKKAWKARRILDVAIGMGEIREKFQHINENSKELEKLFGEGFPQYEKKQTKDTDLLREYFGEKKAGWLEDLGRRLLAPRLENKKVKERNAAINHLISSTEQIIYTVRSQVDALGKHRQSGYFGKYLDGLEEVGKQQEKFLKKFDKVYEEHLKVIVDEALKSQEGRKAIEDIKKENLEEDKKPSVRPEEEKEFNPELDISTDQKSETTKPYDDKFLNPVSRTEPGYPHHVSNTQPMEEENVRPSWWNKNPEPGKDQMEEEPDWARRARHRREEQEIVDPEAVAAGLQDARRRYDETYDDYIKRVPQYDPIREDIISDTQPTTQREPVVHPAFVQPNKKTPPHSEFFEPDEKLRKSDINMKPTISKKIDNLIKQALELKSKNPTETLSEINNALNTLTDEIDNYFEDIATGEESTKSVPDLADTEPMSPEDEIEMDPSTHIIEEKDETSPITERTLYTEPVVVDEPFRRKNRGGIATTTINPEGEYEIRGMNENFYQMLTKVARLNNSKLLAKMILKYSNVIDSKSPDTSLKLLAIAEGILNV